MLSRIPSQHWGAVHIVQGFQMEAFHVFMVTIIIQIWWGQETWCQDSLRAVGKELIMLLVMLTPGNIPQSFRNFFEV